MHAVHVRMRERLDVYVRTSHYYYVTCMYIHIRNRNELGIFSRLLCLDKRNRADKYQCQPVAMDSTAITLPKTR